MSSTTPVLQQLWSVILERQSRPSEKSYTASLLAGGVEKIGRKIVEEAAEVVEAAGEPDDAGREHLVCEAADVIYHLFVMLASRGASLGQVEAELARRFGMSGLEEKASRGTGNL
ncbi:MAG: phosphoribosyl-ATP diphosphatase [Pirellulales bacterium]